MKITSPAAGTNFTISQDATSPAISFQTDGTGPHTWKWSISWGTYTQNGTDSTAGNSWSATPVLTNLGGTLKVTVTAGKDSVQFSAKITGTNPTSAQVNAYLATKPNADGFGSILQAESAMRHFDKNGYPIKSFDNGFGIAQLTFPPPSFIQVWNWKLNVDGGLTLFAAKQTAAKAYLSQNGRSYTADQLKYETVSRWNGGPYHSWDAKAKAWVRNPNIVCDTQDSNAGWDMTNPANQGKTVTQLHARDSAAFSAGRPAAGANWSRFGECYADHLLN